MGVFDFLGKRDPTDVWDDARINERTLDLRSKSFNGIEIGAPVESLQQLGRPSNKQPYRTGVFQYADAGVQVDVSDGRIDYFGLIAIERHDAPIRGFPFDLILPSATSVTIDGTTTWDVIASSLPEPSEIDRDDEYGGETLYVISLDDCTLEIECSLENVIRRVNLFR